MVGARQSKVLIPGCCVLLLLGGMTGRAGAAGIRELADGWLLGPAATDALLGGPVVQDTGVWLLLGQGQLYGLQELPLAAMVAGVRAVQWFGAPSLEFGWQTLGQGLYQEDAYQLHLQWGRRLRVGLRIRSLQLTTGGVGGVPQVHESFGQVLVTFQGGWQWAAGPRLQLHLGLPLLDPESLRLREGRRRLLGLQGWQGAVAVAVAVDTKSDQTLTVGVEWTVAWGGAALGVRVEPSVGSLGPVFAWRRGRLLLRSSHLVHPQLGVTHRFQLGYGLGRSPW